MECWVKAVGFLPFAVVKAFEGRCKEIDLICGTELTVEDTPPSFAVRIMMNLWFGWNYYFEQCVKWCLDPPSSCGGARAGRQ